MMKHYPYLLAALSSIVLIVPAQSSELEKLDQLVMKEGFWESGGERFQVGKAPYFKWLSDDKTSLRYPGYRNSPKINFVELPCYEVIVRLAENKPEALELSLYNRGDAGEVETEKEFTEMLRGVEEKITQWAGDKSKELSPTRLGSGMKVQRKVWIKDNKTAVELKWSGSSNIRMVGDFGEDVKQKFRAEYIQVKLSAFDPAKDPRIEKTKKAGEEMTRHQLVEQLKAETDGTKWMDKIPMVDQGDKGYCAVASAERIFRYYGLEVDQHLLAQVVNSTAEGGTDPDVMIKVLQKLGVKFGVKVRTHFNLDYDKMRSMVISYNRLAKKNDLAEINPETIYSMDQTFRSMDKEVLKTLRVEKDKGGVKSFREMVLKAVNAGVPLAWGVQLGIVEETPKLPQSGGGHMRLVIGYQPDTDQLIYTDSWGRGHEKKSMSMADAWMITTALYTFEPRR